MSVDSTNSTSHPSASVTKLPRRTLVTIPRVVAVTLACTASIVMGATMLRHIPLGAHQPNQPAVAAQTVSPDTFHSPDMPVSPVEPGYLPGRHVLNADTIAEQPATF